MFVFLPYAPELIQKDASLCTDWWLGSRTMKRRCPHVVISGLIYERRCRAPTHAQPLTMCLALRPAEHDGRRSIRLLGRRGPAAGTRPSSAGVEVRLRRRTAPAPRAVKRDHRAVSTDDPASARMFGEVYVLCNRSIDSIIVGPLLPPIVRLAMVSATNCPASRTAGRRMDGELHMAHLSKAGHATRKWRARLQASQPRRGFRGSGASPTRRSG